VPFPEAARAFWLAVTGNKCAMPVYTEETGFQECGSPAKAVHHLLPEGWQLDNGMEPNNSVGIPLCKDHHVGRGGEEWSPEFSMHPDIGHAFKEYRDWQIQVNRASMQLGTDVKHLIPSPFETAIQGHRELTAQGERYWATTPEMDQVLLENMEVAALRYLVEHPEEEKPHVKEHPHYQPKKNWWEEI